MNQLFRLLLIASLGLNVYLDWQRSDSWIKSRFALFNIIRPELAVQTAPPYKPQKVDDFTLQLKQSNRYFYQGNTDAALHEYNALLQQATNAEELKQINMMKQQWFKSIFKNLKAAKNNEVELNNLLIFIQSYLTKKFNDSNAQIIEAELFVALKRDAEAIESYLNLIQQHRQKEDLHKRFKDLINQYLNTLMADKQWQEVIEQGQNWLSEQPENLTLLSFVVDAHLALGELFAAKSLLEELPPALAEQEQVIKLTEKIRKAGSKVSRISLKPSGEHYILQAEINGIQVKLMIDTGASYSAITTEQFAMLSEQAEYLDTITSRTANGLAEFNLYQADSITIGDKTLAPYKFAVMPNGGRHGLLGMNFLKHFTFKIDQNTNELVLK